MNSHDILFYGNKTIKKAFETIPAEKWHLPNVCGWWSVREIAAHLASFEALLVDVLNLQQGLDTPTPTFTRLTSPDYDFNNEEVALRENYSATRVIEEYDQAHAQAMSLVTQLDATHLTQTGTIPWYGEAYSLDDFIVYAYYGHKREHAAQIHVFKDQFKGEG